MKSSRTVEINLPEAEWSKIDGLLTADPKMTHSEYFRRLHIFFERNKDAWWKLGGLEHYEDVTSVQNSGFCEDVQAFKK